jgi:hypothetical protein
MRERLFILILAVAGVLLFNAGTPKDAVGFTGCNQICSGDFPGECVYYYASYFCHDANPPWYPCEFVYLEDCIKVE